MPIINLKELVGMAIKIIVRVFFKIRKSTEQDSVNTCVQFAELQISFKGWVPNEEFQFPLLAPNHSNFFIYLLGHVPDLVRFLTQDPSLIWNTTFVWLLLFPGELSKVGVGMKSVASNVSLS